jgi:hypothetical protein
MKSILRPLLAFVLLFFSFVQVSALGAPVNLKLEEALSGTLKVSWDSLTDASWYYVYYSKESWGYDMQIDDIIEWNSAAIKNLDADTTYYISVTSVDLNWDESANSTELVAKTKIWEKSKFFPPLSLEGTKTVSFTEVELTFSNKLSDNPEYVREFKVVNKSDSLDELSVIKTELDADDKKKLVLTFDRNALPHWEYELTVLDLKDENDSSIESWIDGISSFTMPEKFEVKVEPEPVVEEEEKVPESEEIIPDNEEVVADNDEKQEFNSAGPVDDKVSWASLGEKDIEKNTVSESKKVDKLPKTWAGHVLIIVLAFALAGLLFLFRFKKS